MIDIYQKKWFFAQNTVYQIHFIPTKKTLVNTT